MNEAQSFILRGSNLGESLEFVALPDISTQSFSVTASFRGYRVSEAAVTIFAGSAFLAELKALETTRSGRASVTGTYDFALAFEPFEHRGAVLVSFCVSNLLLHRPANTVAGRSLIEGAVVVDGEHVGGMVSGLIRLFEGRGAY